MGKVPNDKKLQNAARAYAHDNGLKALSKDEDGKMKSIKEVILGLDQVTGSMRGFLSPNLGLANAETAGKNLLKDFLKSDPAINSFGVTRELAIRTLSTLVSGEGSGVRITQAEVNMVNQNWPKLTDPLPVALAKMAWQKQFLMNKVTVALGEKARPDVGVSAYTKLPPGAQFNDNGEVKVVRKSTGVTGWIMPDDEDFKLYEVVPNVP